MYNVIYIYIICDAQKKGPLKDNNSRVIGYIQINFGLTIYYVQKCTQQTTNSQPFHLLLFTAAVVQQFSIMTYLCFIISLFSTCTTCFLIFFTNLTSCVRRKNINFYYVVWNLSAILHKKNQQRRYFSYSKNKPYGVVLYVTPLTTILFVVVCVDLGIAAGVGFAARPFRFLLWEF